MHPLFDYGRKAHADETLVACVRGDGGLIHRDMLEFAPPLDAAGRRFGFRTVTAPTLATCPQPAPNLLSHLIIVTDAPFDAGVVERAVDALGCWRSASLAFAYASGAEMRAAERSIDMWKRAAGPRLNFLFPDTVRDAVHFVSVRKIIDNAVCDTVRVKYMPRQTAPAVALPARVRKFLLAASALYAREELYLRAPTDGYIAARSGNGFFITATQTSKVDLDLARVSFVEAYDSTSNVLTYRGAFLPSSDAVEAALVFETHRATGLLLHTHASKFFTRNPAFRARVLVPQLPYGEPALGHALCDALARVADGFVIMEEHGEVFAGAGDCDAFVRAVARRCREARADLACV